MLGDIEETLKSSDKEDIEVEYERLREVIRKLEISKNKLQKRYLMRKRKSKKYVNGTKNKGKR